VSADPDVPASYRTRDAIDFHLRFDAARKAVGPGLSRSAAAARYKA